MTDAIETPPALVTLKHDETALARIRDTAVAAIQPVPDGPIAHHHHFTAIAANVATRKKAIRAFEDHFKPLKKAIDVVKDGLLGLERGLVSTLKESNRIDEDRAVAWNNLQVRLAREETQRLQAIADEKARVETERLLEIARQEAEEAAIMAAAAAEASGDTEAAQAITEAPVEAPHVEPVAPREVKPLQPILVADKTTIRDNWSAVVTDKGALIRQVAANPALERYLDTNTVEINALARASKGGPCPLDGVEWVNKPSVVSR